MATAHGNLETGASGRNGTNLGWGMTGLAPLGILTQGLAGLVRDEFES